MKKQLEVLITSGGTISKIDDVRHIGNDSKGTTGAMIAEEFLREGAKVYYLHRKNSVIPFSRNLTVDKDKPFEQELERIKPVYEEFQNFRENYKAYSFDTFESYYNSVERLLLSNSIDIVVLAAAVSDYGAKKVDGKISSDRENLTIKLEKTPKVISLIKKWKPHVFQVGFKLLSNVSADELVDTAYQHGLKNHSDLTVANDEKLNTFLITPEKGILPVKRQELAEKLVELVNQRISDSY